MFRGARRRRQARRSRNQQQGVPPSTGTAEREAGSEQPADHGNPWIQWSMKFFKLLIYLTLLAYTYKKKKEEKVLAGAGGEKNPNEDIPTIVHDSAMDGVAMEETYNDVKSEEKSESDEL
eukprot:CAMPEP_0194308188 /NCGR_PEP_ID=MMETSP0171-20130528/5113_1 /TAXON_ID=218684 /ORGANISM="Corethron pennatum, Strain L29A3" /LENGTH=119 /DNA_ID=CAMNT_0039060657 /DNA_START=56 /DNA_END=415 /DNA_ORIENTATION=-